MTLNELQQLVSNNNTYFEKELNEKFISQKFAQDLLEISKHRAEEVLTKLFGGSTSFEEEGILDIGLKFSDLSFGNFIIFSYQTIYGNIPAVVGESREKNQVQKRRLNLYKKGYRWSSKENENLKLEDSFYYFLDFFDRCLGITPMKFFCETAYKSGIQYFILTTNKNEDRKQAIILPNRDDFNKIDAAKQILSLVDKYLLLSKKDFNEAVSEFAKEEDADQDKLSENAVRLKTKAIKNEFAELKDSFTKIFKLNSDDFNENDFYQLIIASILFQYNDLPFELNVFVNKKPALETSKNLEPKDLATLMISSEKNNSLDMKHTTVEYLTKIVTEIGKLSKLEDNLILKAKNFLDYYWQWKNLYDINYSKYERLAAVMVNLCKSIKEEKNIKCEVSFRIKTFDSLFNKIVNAANELDENGNCKNFIQYNKQDKQALIDYRKSLLDPHKWGQFVFEELRDIAGVRIICAYWEDAFKFLAIFEELQKEGDIYFNAQESDIKVYAKNRETNYYQNVDSALGDDNYNYRSIHFTIKLGDKRKKIFEYKSLMGIKCEIQVRSILAHGWSDVQHGLEYKTKIPLKILDEKRYDKLAGQLGELSEQLYKSDEFINEIRKSN